MAAENGGTSGVVDNSVIVPLGRREGPTGTALFHALGGGLGHYLGLAPALARKGPLHGLRALGIQPGEEPDRTIAAMARRYAALLRELPQPPRLLVGWSFGGLLAWETGQLLADTTGFGPDVVLIDSSSRDWDAHDPVLRGIRERVLWETVAALGPESLEPVRRTLDAHIGARLAHRITPARHRSRTLLLTCTRGDDPEQAAAWGTLIPDLTVRSVDADHFGVFSRTTLPVVTGHLDDFINHSAGATT